MAVDGRSSSLSPPSSCFLLLHFLSFLFSVLAAVANTPQRNDASPASFEKALSALATKIANTQAKLEQTRSSSRRVRVLCTLYLAFGYLVYTIVLALVVGRKKMGAWEWSGVAGGPVL